MAELKKSVYCLVVRQTIHAPSVIQPTCILTSSMMLALIRWMERHNQIEYEYILTSRRGNGSVRIVKIPKIRKEG